ncbi:MAG: PilZ domain-containing protein [candidate division FCPU426 bacterium]
MPPVVKRKTDASDRRRYSRQPLKMAVNFRSVERGKISPLRRSRSDDLSAGGLGMHSLTKLKQGQMLVLSLVIPRGRKKNALDAVRAFSKSQGDPTSILSRVVYCRPTDHKKKYRLGIQFLDLDQESRRRFRQFLLDNRLLKTTSRLYI